MSRSEHKLKSHCNYWGTSISTLLVGIVPLVCSISMQHWLIGPSEVEVAVQSLAGFCKHAPSLEEHVNNAFYWQRKAQVPSFTSRTFC